MAVPKDRTSCSPLHSVPAGAVAAEMARCAGVPGVAPAVAMTGAVVYPACAERNEPLTSEALHLRTALHGVSAITPADTHDPTNTLPGDDT